MRSFKSKFPGLMICLAIAVPSWLFGRRFPTVGGPVAAILAGMVLTLFWKDKGRAKAGIAFTSKYILQAAVVLLGFGLNLHVVLETGIQSLPIILCTISTSLILAWLMQRIMNIQSRTAILVGVGSSICGGSAIAATAPVIDADDDEIAQAISVIFFFNMLAALFFPMLGQAIGMSTSSGEAFGIFAGTAVNDTSSVTAAASTWDSMFGLGSAALDKAVTVKLTRTLAIIPITVVLAYCRARRESGGNGGGAAAQLRRAFPRFILWFVLASLLTTAAMSFGAPASVFQPMKEWSKFLIIMAMGAIGLNSNIVQLVRTGQKPLLLGAVCWAGISCASLALQRILGLW